MARLLVAALGADLTSVKCQGEWLTVGVTTDAVVGTTLTIDILENGEAATLQKWVQEVGAAVQAQVLVTDDADGFKTAADENGLKHQVGEKHVLNNTEAWHDAMAPELARDRDGSLAQIAVTPEQAVADNDELLRLLASGSPPPKPMPSWPKSTPAMRKRAHRRSSAKLKRPWPTVCGCSAWIAGIFGNA